MTDFFAELEGHLHDAARRRARRRRFPVPAVRIVFAVVAAAATLAIVFTGLSVIGDGRDPEVAVPPAPTPPAATDGECGDVPPPPQVGERFAVLRRDRTGADEAPPEVLDRLEQEFPGTGLPAKIWPEEGRLARTVADRRIWLFPVLLGKACPPPLMEVEVPEETPREPGICWVYVDEEPTTAMCHRLVDVQHAISLVMSEGPKPFVTGLVPDGESAIARNGGESVKGTIEGNIFFADGATELVGEAQRSGYGCRVPTMTDDAPPEEILGMLSVLGEASADPQLPRERWDDGVAASPIRVHERGVRAFAGPDGLTVFAVPFSPLSERCNVPDAPTEAGVCLVVAPENSEFSTKCFSGQKISDGRAFVYDGEAWAYALLPDGTRKATVATSSGNKEMVPRGNFAFVATDEEPEGIYIDG